MASLTGQLVAETYKALLKLIDNDILTASEKQITDGFGGGSNVFIDSQGFLRANKYKVTNGLATQFLKADGSLDANSYLTSITGAQVITALGYTPVPTTRTITINGETHNLAANNTWTIAGTAAIWGNITGTLSNQTDLQNALNAKFNNPTGTTAQYIRGDGTLATLPSAAVWGNITGTLADQADLQSALNAKQNALSGTGFVKASGTTITYDNSTYLTTADAASTYQRLDKMVSNLLPSATEYPNSNAVIAALALKANAANPVFTGNMTISGAEPKLFFTDTDNNPDYTIFIDSGVFYIYDQTAGTTRFSISSSGNISAGIGKSITADSFIKDGGAASQFLKADGSIDSNTYVASSALANYLLISTAASTYQRLDKMVSNLLPSSTEYPNSNAVINALALKADAANPVFTGNMTINGAEPKLFFVDTDNNPDYTVFVDSGFFYIYDQTAGATRFSINSSGNISTGVGKSITAGSFVKDGGTSSQYLMADGSVTTLTGVVTGSGTGNYITKWATGSTISNSIIYDNGSSVGIGATTLARKLEVITGNGVTNGIRLTYANGSTTEGMDITYLNSGQTTTSFDSLYNSASAVMQFRMKTAATPVTAMTIFGSGNISTGSNTDAGYSFDINGTLRVQNNASFSGTGRFFNTLTFAGGDRKFECADSGGVSFYTNEINANAQGVTGSLYFGWRGTTALNFGVTSNFSTNINVNGQGRFYGVSVPIRTESTANNEMQIVRATTTNGAGFGFYTNAAHNWLLGTAWGETSSNFILYNAATGTQTMRVDYSNNDVTFSNKVVSNDQFRVLASGNYRINNNVNGLIGYLIRSGAWKGNAENNISLATDGPYGISFFTNGTGVEKFHVTSGGNIVINNGTTDAGYKLDVNGTGRFQGTLQSDNATTAELRLRGGGYGTNYNTSLRSVAGASGILQFGNNGENYVLIGNTAAGGYLDFRTNCSSESTGSGSPALRLYANTSAYFWSSVTATSFFESSDFRLKTLIESNPIIDGIENLQAKLYEKNGKIELGYFAQDAELIMPYAVTKNDEGFLNLSYREVHTAKIARLEQRVAELEKQLNLN